MQSQVRTPFLSHCYAKTPILSRQARDKHRKTQNKTRFLTGHLQHYSVIYIIDHHVSEATMKAISDWVKAGGIAYFEAGGGALNEFNSTGRARYGNACFAQYSFNNV